MADVLFYHLTESTLEDALPGLLERSIDRGWRAVVQTGTEERRDALDQHLWTQCHKACAARAINHLGDGYAVTASLSEAIVNGSQVRRQSFENGIASALNFCERGPIAFEFGVKFF